MVVRTVVRVVSSCGGGGVRGLKNSRVTTLCVMYRRALKKWWRVGGGGEGKYPYTVGFNTRGGARE